MAEPSHKLRQCIKKISFAQRGGSAAVEPLATQPPAESMKTLVCTARYPGRFLTEIGLFRHWPPAGGLQLNLALHKLLEPRKNEAASWQPQVSGGFRCAIALYRGFCRTTIANTSVFLARFDSRVTATVRTETPYRAK